MSEPVKWTDKIHWLSHHKGEVACFYCPRCGKDKNYDVNSMLKVLGDIAVPSLPDVVSKAVGCQHFAEVGWNRCRMAPSWPTFQKIDLAPYVQVPRGYLPLEDTALGKMSEWQIVYGKCRCGRTHYIDRRELIRKYGADALTNDLAKRLLCKRCKRRGFAIFIFRTERR